MSFTTHARAGSKSSRFSVHSELLLRRSFLLCAGLAIAVLSIAAPASESKDNANKSAADDAPIPQIIIIGKRMTPEQKRKSLEAEQRAEKAQAEARLQTAAKAGR